MAACSLWLREKILITFIFGLWAVPYAVLSVDNLYKTVTCTRHDLVKMFQYINPFQLYSTARFGRSGVGKENQLNPDHVFLRYQTLCNLFCQLPGRFGKAWRELEASLREKRQQDHVYLRFGRSVGQQEIGP